jgi:diguanylate cyclase (GGDEF)-like protein
MREDIRGGVFMVKSLKKRVLGLIAIFVVIINAATIYFNFNNFVNTQKNYSISTANTVAKTCVLIIESDRIEEYADTLKRDSSYYETWNKLIDYRNTNSKIMKLSLVHFTEDGCHYIFDTDLTKNGAFLGDYKAYETKQLKHKEALITGKNIGSIVYPDHLDAYTPVLSSYDIPVGYIIIGISTVDDAKEQIVYLIETILILSFLTLLLTILFTYFLNRRVINPINLLSEAAANYSESIDFRTNTSSLERLKINTGDELERLCDSIKKMEKDILNSENSLIIATWNSYHDSMTQLHNKSYLAESLPKFKQMDSIGVIYFDVDNLKEMNDTNGHYSGDEVIKKAARFLIKYSTELTSCFRIGGDEFLMIVANCSQTDLISLVEKMKADPDTNLSDPDNPVQCHISIGSSFAAGNIDIEKLINKADENMYIDKHSHR